MAQSAPQAGSRHRAPPARQLRSGRDAPAAGSEAVEDYVRAISRTARGPRRIASTTEVADFLAVTPASVSSMFKKLARLELVVYAPYRGVTLTRRGAQLASHVTRRRRLLEAFLVDALGMALEHVDREADRLEHHISSEFEALIAAHLGEPLQDSPGDPVAPADASVPAPPRRAAQSSSELGSVDRSAWASA